MTNLLEETQEAIKNSGHSTEDVMFVGSVDGKYGLTWDAFTSISDIEYYSGYGSPEIATDLVIRFSDGRSMWRSEYDGSEWWDFDVINNTVYDPFKAKPLLNVKGRLWPTVEDLHERDENA